MTTFKLPDLGEGLPDAEIHEWYVAQGDTVKVDQPLVAMETAKAVVDVPSPFTGKVLKLCGKKGDMIQTGAALVEFEEEKPAQQTKVAATVGSQETDKGTVVGVIESGHVVLVESPTGIAVKTSSAAVKATPAVRMLANTLGVDLTAVVGSGPGSVITTEDVKRVALAATHVSNKDGISKQKPTVPLKDTLGEPLRGARRTMAQVMANSHAQVVPVTLTEDADMHRWPDKIDITLRIIQAIIAACQAEPILNAHFYGETLSHALRKEINLGIAVDTPEGLYVPVIRDIARLSTISLRETINAFKEKAKTNAFSPQELQDNTITLSNFGTIIGRYANPIVVPPTVAILGIGKLRYQVVAEVGKPAIHPVLPISLTFDHRAVTGGEAARFLAAFIDCIEQA